MKCEIHNIEMEYAGEDPFGGDIWICQACEDEEDYYVWHNDAYQQDHPEEYPELWEDEEDLEDWEVAESEVENSQDFYEG